MRCSGWGRTPTCCAAPPAAGDTRRSPLPPLGLVLFALAGAVGCGSSGGGTVPLPITRATYQMTPLVSDQAGVAAHTDPKLVNPWGVAFSPTGPFWIANNHSGTATL